MKAIFTMIASLLAAGILCACSGDDVNIDSEISIDTLTEQEIAENAVQEKTENDTNETETAKEEKTEIFPEYTFKFADYGKEYKEKLADSENTVRVDLKKSGAWEYQYVITIDGKVFSDVAQMPAFPSERYCIFDMDVTDGRLQIALQDYGPSDDYCMEILEYDGTELSSLGFVEGVFDAKRGFGEVTCNGNGRISSYIRLSVFQTWFAKADFILSDGKIVLEEKDYYEATEPVENIRVVNTVTIYDTPDKDSFPSFLLEGHTITALGTDNKEWVKIKVDNRERWIRLCDEGMRVYLSEREAEYTWDLFDGLIFAD